MELHQPEELFKKLREEQKRLKSKIINIPIKENINLIAGCDCSIISENIFSVFVVFEYPSLNEIEIKTNISKIDLPYVPGFLSFREIPNLLLTYSKLKYKPDVIMIDGQGIMHPQRMGIATHLGLKLQIPTVGVAKKKLFGKYNEPKNKKGDYTEVLDGNETIGFALRSKLNTNPLFISPGHFCDLNSALTLTMKTIKSYKLPEPTRIADKYSHTKKAT